MVRSFSNLNRYKLLAEFVCNHQNVLTSTITYKSQIKKSSKALEKELTRTLPFVIEEILMYVKCGKDLLTALETFTLNNSLKDNLLTDLLKDFINFIQEGLSFENTVELVLADVKYKSIEHFFLFLTLAYRSGGQLSESLTELSLATQINYQQIVEEQVEKLPALALIPILFTFAGLLVIFLLGPILKFFSFLNLPGGVIS
jgi:type II secretory pathway component PulF